MKRVLLPLFGILLLAGCAAGPQTRNKPYPDVKVSRLLKVIDGDTFRCDIDEHSGYRGQKHLHPPPGDQHTRTEKQE